MQKEQADKEEAERIIERSVHWFDENIMPDGWKKDLESFDWVDQFCELYCIYVKEKFDITVEFTETGSLMKRNVVLHDCSNEALTMMKLVMT